MMVTLAPLASPVGNVRRLIRSRLGPAAVLLGTLFFVASAAAAGTSTTTLSSSSSAVTSGATVTLTATVFSGSTPVTPGQVAFCDAATPHCTDIHRLAVAPLIAGNASYKFVPGPGSHSYRAIFLATSLYVGSNSTAVTVSVSPKRSTTTSIAQSGSVGNYSEFSVVSGVGGVPPTGTVSFLDTSNANYPLGTATLAPSTPALGFTNFQTLSTGNFPDAVVAGDFDGDGKLDLAIANYSSGSVTILTGNGDGSFTYHAILAGFSNPTAMVAADFNNDGRLDLAVLNFGTNQVWVMLGTGGGNFGSVHAQATGGAPGGLAVGDFNNDGYPDLAVSNGSSSNLSVLLGQGNGSFTVAASPATGGNPSSVAVADFNNDGNQDLVVTSLSGRTATVFLGTGTGTFSPGFTSGALGVPYSVVTADFDGDGNQDFVAANFQGGAVVVFLGAGNDTFTASSLTVGAHPIALAVGDFNGDGIPDLVAVNDVSATSGSVSVLLGKGDGTFQTYLSQGVGSDPRSAAAGDFNGDGIADVAAANYGDSTATVLLEHPGQSATATASGLSPVGTGTHVIVASYPGDANFAASTSGASGLTAQQVTTSLVLSADPATSVSGQSVTLTASLSPTAAQNHSTDGATVTFTRLGTVILGTGTLAAGLATLTVSALPAGVSTLAASFPGDANFRNSASNTLFYTVSSVTSTSLAITSAGSVVTSVAAGTAITLTATVFSGSSPVTPGLVAFCEATAPRCTDIHRLGTAQLTSSGAATLRFTPAIGSHSYKAVFLGTAAASTSSSPVTPLAVTGLFPTVTHLASSGSPGNYTLAASVVSLTRSPLSGTVSFADTTNANASLGSTAIPFSSSTFALGAPQSAVTGTQPKAVATGDFNGDGKPDFATADFGSSTVTVQLGNGDGTFTAAPSLIATLSNPDGLAVGDFNGDGKQDLAVANYASGTVSIFLGNGDGTFTAGSPVSASAPGAVVVGDFNNDGNADLAIANIYNNSLAVLLGHGDGTFTAVPGAPPATGNYPTAIVAADFNNDGVQDLAVANVNDRTITVFFGSGGGQFPTSRTLTNTGGSYSLATADVDGDGNADLIALDSGGNTVTVLRGDGTGAFAAQASPVTATNPMAVAVGDVDGDGIPDLVTANSNANAALNVFLGNGDGTFQSALPYAAGLLPQGLALADFNGDGDADPVTANYGSNNASVLLAQSQQTALVSVNGVSPMGSGATHAAQATYPGDTTHASSTSNLVSLVPLPYAVSPAFAPAGGTYTSAQTVSLSTTTPGATIFYTTDGSTPSASSIQYLAPISVSASETIKAIASAANYQTSPVATAAYTINYPPTIATQPASQTISSGSTATLTVAATSATQLTYQWYSGGSPNTANPISGATASTYTTPVLTATTPPVATFSYWVQVNNASAVPANSSTATVTVNALPVAAAPTFSPPGGTYTSVQSVSLATTTPYPYGAIYYTTDGSIPTATSAQYTGPIPVAASETIRAFAAGSGYQNSPVSSAAYTIVYPPAITTQPASRTIAYNTTATLTVIASGTAPLTYQWYNGSSPDTASPIPGATAAAYTTPALTSTSSFWVQVNNTSGVTADSNTAVINVITPPTITNQPASQTINSGSSATLSVSATGTAPLTYQWFGSPGVPIPGATSATYTTPALTSTASYQVQVSNTSGVPATSALATVTVVTPPTITNQPASQTINAGSTANLFVSASGTGPLSYQWYAGVSPSTASLIVGATSPAYTTPPLTATSSFWVQVTNASGTPANSATAAVTVITPPTITNQPASQTVNTGQTVTLSVSAGGTAPLTYQWSGGASASSLVPIAGATASSYTSPALTATTYFQVQVANSSRVPATSGIAIVTVIQAPTCTLSVQPTSTALTVVATSHCTDPRSQALTQAIAWGDGSSSPVDLATNTNAHGYAAAGTYTVTLSATNASGLTGTATQRFSPNQSPVCTLGVVQGQISTVLTVYPVTVSGGCKDPQGQPLTLSIDWGDGTVVVPGGPPYTHTYSSSTTVTYNVVLTATDTSGLTGSTAPQPVQIVPAKSIPAGGSTDVSSTIPAPPVTPPAHTLVTFVCSSVSVQVNGQTINTLPSTYGISCTSPSIPLTSTPVPVDVSIFTSNGAVASNRAGPSSSALALCGLTFPLVGLALLLPLTPGRRRQFISLVVTCVLCVSLAGCGGSFRAPAIAATPSGLYYITLVETVVPPQVAPTGFVQTSLIVPLPVTH